MHLQLERLQSEDWGSYASDGGQSDGGQLQFGGKWNRTSSSLMLHLFQIVEALPRASDCDQFLHQVFGSRCACGDRDGLDSFQPVGVQPRGCIVHQVRRHARFTHTSTSRREFELFCDPTTSRTWQSGATAFTAICRFSVA